MIELLKDKKAVFFDVGYTLDYPASGNWMLTKGFYELAGELAPSKDEMARAVAECAGRLGDEVILTVEKEHDAFLGFYRALSERLKLGFTESEIAELAYGKVYDMSNYVAYPDALEVVKTLSKTHKLGVISDTWPSIELQLRSIGLLEYFDTATYSCFLKTAKPDRRMYLDALGKMGLPAEDTVFIDDIPRNLEGAAQLGITPVLIAANPPSDVETPYTKIHSLKELL